MKAISGKQVYKMTKDNMFDIIIDVRDTDKYNLGHIPNAVNIPLEDIPDNMRVLSEYKNESILIYCSKGYKSESAAKYLEKKGFSNIYTLTNGFNNYSYKTV